MIFLVNRVNVIMIHTRLNFSKFCVFIFLVVVITYCSESENINPSCFLIKEMNEKDQLYRGDTRANPLEYIIDSLTNTQDAHKDEVYDEAINILQQKKIIKDKSIKSSFWNNKQKVIADSLMQLQIEIDKKNIKVLLNWLDKIEHNKMDTLPCFSSIFLMLAHVNEDLLLRINRTIEEKKKYFDPIEYNYIRKILDMKMEERVTFE